MKKKNGGGDRDRVWVRVTGRQEEKYKQKIHDRRDLRRSAQVCIMYRVCKVRACVASEPGYEPNAVKNMRSRVRHPSGKSS